MVAVSYHSKTSSLTMTATTTTKEIDMYTLTQRKDDAPDVVYYRRSSLDIARLSVALADLIHRDEIPEIRTAQAMHYNQVLLAGLPVSLRDTDAEINVSFTITETET